MECIYCGSHETKVVNSAKAENEVLRERVCQSCLKRFWTKETATPEEQCFIKSQLEKIRRYNKKRRGYARIYREAKSGYHS